MIFVFLINDHRIIIFNRILTMRSSPIKQLSQDQSMAQSRPNYQNFSRQSKYSSSHNQTNKEPSELERLAKELRNTKNQHLLDLQAKNQQIKQLLLQLAQSKKENQLLLCSKDSKSNAEILSLKRKVNHFQQENQQIIIGREKLNSELQLIKKECIRLKVQNNLLKQALSSKQQSIDLLKKQMKQQKQHQKTQKNMQQQLSSPPTMAVNLSSYIIKQQLQLRIQEKNLQHKLQIQKKNQEIKKIIQDRDNILRKLAPLLQNKKSFKQNRAQMTLLEIFLKRYR